MEEIRELYRERERLLGWATATAIVFPLFGITFGLLLQAKIVDKKIRKKVMAMGDTQYYVVLTELDREKEEKTK